MSKTFNPSNYCCKKINQDNCNHEVIVVDLSDDGVTQESQTCLICGKNMEDELKSGVSLDEKFIFNNFGPNKKKNLDLLTHLLEMISARYDQEDYIDLVKYFNLIGPTVSSNTKYVSIR